MPRLPAVAVACMAWGLAAHAEDCPSPAVRQAQEEALRAQQTLGEAYRQYAALCSAGAAGRDPQACKERNAQVEQLRAAEKAANDKAFQARRSDHACSTGGASPAERERAARAGMALPPGAKITEMLDRPTAADYLPVPPKAPTDARRVCARGDNRPPSREQAFDVLAEWARKHAGVPWCSVNWPFVISKWQQAIGQPATGEVDGDFKARLRAEVAAAQRRLDGTLMATQTGVIFGLETLSATSTQDATASALPAELCWSSGSTIRCARDANCVAVLNDAYRASGESKGGYDAELLACQRVAKFRGETASSFRFGTANPQSAVLRYAGGRLGELRFIARGASEQVAAEMTRRHGAPRVEQVQYTRDVVVGSEERVVPGYVQFGVIYPPYVTTVSVYAKQPYTMPKRSWSASGLQAEEMLDDVGNPTGEFVVRFSGP